MAAKQIKKLAKKYVSKPEDYPDHKYWEIEKYAQALQDQGFNTEQIQGKLIEYVENERDKCMADPVYFANSFGFIIGHGSSGVMPMTCAPY